ncbi:hypothetical protein SBRCBS47491_007871 [Sporothrix bragantina]|uniref:Xylanolytic transcriptional activator regulatory domain-containing protein n=1 Tax=Sporothrix bragantina TaxID=671064 RepID=A0ABP0CJK4_9PEZI
MPCRNCLADGSPCEVRESRRGKHPRRRASDQPSGAAAKAPRPSVSAPSQQQQHQPPQVHGGVDEVAASEALVTLLQNNNSSNNNKNPPSRDDRPSLGHLTGRHSDSTETAETVKSVSPASVNQHAAATTASQQDAEADADVEPGSSAVFIGSVFLGESTTLRYVHSDAADGDAEQPDDTSPGSTVHLLHQVPEPEIDNTLDTVDGSSGHVVGHGQGTNTNKNRPAPAWVVERRRIKMQFLQASGAFTYPPAATVDALLDAYFCWFHPCFAIVDEAETRQRYREGTLSPLLLQAMLFIGAVHGGDRQHLAETQPGTDDTDNTSPSSPSSKYVYYNRCKDLYDADYECDKVTIIQAVFLMSFWRSGPFLEKDTRHWLATAISLAQSKAMHRSATRVGTRVGKASANGSSSSPTAAASAPNKDVTMKRDAARRLKQLKQRLWWSIYTREQQCAAALGLPSRISDEDCDVAPLQVQDFEFAFEASQSSNSSAHDGVAFQVGATGLARILGKIIRHGYAPGRTLTAACKTSLRQELRAWKPASLDGDDGMGSSTATFYTRLLHLTYNNLLILIYRPAYIKKDHRDPKVDEEGRIALEAAAQNSRIVEDLVAGPTLLASLRHAPVHVITNLFNTLCMHTIHLRRLAHGIRGGEAANDDKKMATKKDDTNVAALTIAEHRAKVCLLGLQELQRTWDVRNWILQLFFQYLDRATAARLSVDDKSLTGVNTANTNSHFPMKTDMATPREIPGQLALPVPPLPMATSLATDQPPPWMSTGVDGGEYGDPASAETVDMLFSSPWTNVPTLEEQQIYLFSQMETDNLALGEGGGLCGYWGPSDPNMGLGQVGVMDNMTDFLGRM